jgi:hypothetical protein
MNCFCTIISPDYYPFARTLYQSLAAYMPGARFHILIIGDHLPAYADKNENILFNNPEDLNGQISTGGH